MNARDIDEVASSIIDDELDPGRERTIENENLLFAREMIAKIFDDKKIEMKTDLTDKEIMLISRCQIYSDYFKIGVLDKFLTKLMRMKLSKKRASRQEMVDIIAKSYQGEEEKRISDKLLGKTL